MVEEIGTSAATIERDVGAGLLLIIAAIGMIVSFALGKEAIKQLRVSRRAKNWVKVNAEVIEHTERMVGGKKEYYLVYRYEYGDSMNHRKIEVSEDNVEGMYNPTLLNKLFDLEKGSDIQVLVNPENPKETIIGKPSVEVIQGLFAVVVFSLVVSVLIIYAVING